MGRTLDIFVIILAFGMGVLLLTGHSDFILNTRNDKSFSKRYDRRKVELASGAAFIIAGILTVIDMLIQSQISSIIYLVLIVIDYTVLFIYMNKCKKQ